MNAHPCPTVLALRRLSRLGTTGKLRARYVMSPEQEGQGTVLTISTRFFLLVVALLL